MKPLSCLNSHKGAVVRPNGCQFLNYEGEVAIVIGRTCKNVRISEALSYVAGYCLANDFALHDFRDADRGSMLRVKGADTLGVAGPGLVQGWTPGDQVLRTRVNGKVVQESSLKGMIWDMAYLVADLARVAGVEIVADAPLHRLRGEGGGLALDDRHLRPAPSALRRASRPWPRPAAWAERLRPAPAHR